MMIRRLSIFVLSIALFAPVNPRAQDQSDGTLHVLRPSINAEQEKAEFCLEFDHPLDLTDKGRVIAAIHLQSEGKTVSVTQPNLSLSATAVCLQSLAHEEDYSLTVTDLRGSHGEKLTEPYKLSFTIPDRKPALAFAGDPGAGDLPHYRDSDPILRAVNVANVHVMLFRITDPARMADAYRQRMQTTLAPSESLTFAKDNGQLVWRGDFTLTDSDDTETANLGLEQPLPLRKLAGDLPSGLYMVVAGDEAAEAKPKKKKKETELGPLAAQWFVYSDLNIDVFSKNDGFFVEAQNADMSAVAKNVKLLLLGHDQQTLVEGKTDANGTAQLAWPQDKRGDATTIVGLTDAGDVDFADISSDADVIPENHFTLPASTENLITDRQFYAPGEQVYLTLTARNIHDEAVTMPSSTLQILRPDHSIYATIPVPDGKAGVSIFSIAAPLTNGKWLLQWQQADGHSLAQGVLRVTSNKLAPHIEINADRPALNNDGELNLSVKSKTDNGKPASYISGRIFVQWSEPDTLSGWSDYRFGTGEKKTEIPVAIGSFLTDAGGAAQVHLNIRPPAALAPLRTAAISVKTDPVMGVLDPEPIALPVQPDNYVIGIKPTAPDGKFSENSLAQFYVIALGGDGKRRDAPGLKYQIYEEGRNFSWYQSDGRWEYKQLQQRRRISGGPFDVKINGANVIRWRVAAGSYTLELTDADGNILTRYHFDAGWGLFKPSQPKPIDLKVTSDQPFIQPGKPVKISFSLDRPALVNTIIADDHVRKIIYEARNPGNNDIIFSPGENWGNHIRIQIDAKEKTDSGFTSLAGQIDIAVRHASKELNVALPSMQERITAGQELTLPITVSNIAAHPAFVSVVVVPVSDDNFDPSVSSIFLPPIEIDGSGRAVARLPVPVFSGDLLFKAIISSQNQYLQKEWSVPVRQAFDADLFVPSILREGDNAHLVFGLKNNSAAPDSYRYVMTATDGLKPEPAADGKISIPAKTQKIFPFNLEATGAGSNDLKLEVTNSRDNRVNRTWPVAVLANYSFNIKQKSEVAAQQNWTQPQPDKEHAKENRDGMFFVSATPVYDSPKILESLLSTSPFTTKGISAWFEATQLWQDVAGHTGLMPASAWQARQKDILMRILARQKPDGSFPVLPDGDSDLVSTAAALHMLSHTDASLNRSAIDAAAGWLKQKLSNTWFDEAERPARAAAFAALAAADRLDVSSLRYFAETSTDKPLPPLAMAQLAVALAKSGDNDKAGFWLKALHEQLSASPELLPVAADNPLFNPQDLLPTLQKLSGDLVQNSSHDVEALSSFLRALWIVNARGGNWTASINGANKTQGGVMVIPAPGKSAPLAIHAADKTLYVVEAERMPSRAERNPTITRHIYQMDGNERAANELGQGETYVVTLEGNWPNDSAHTQKLLVHDASGSNLSPVSCLFDGDISQWGWIKNFLNASVMTCEATESGLDAVLTANDKNNWKIAYLARAGQAGTYSLAPATAHMLSSSEWLSSGETRIGIK